MSSDWTKRNVILIALTLALAGLVGLFLTLALAIASQPRFVELEKTLELREACSISARELVGLVGIESSVSRIDIELFNTGEEPVIVRYRGSELILDPEKSIVISFTDLNEEVEVKESQGLNVRVGVKVVTVEGGSLVLTFISLLLFFLSSVLLSIGTVLLFYLAVSRRSEFLCCY
ncbi:MAG: hypothetical protein QXP64_03860 [Acidilobaceae archaeon]